MILNKLIILSMFLVVFSMFSQNKSQFNVGFVSNAQYYLDDDVTGDFTEEDRFRSNNYLKFDYTISNFEFGLQLEGYAPQRLLSYSPNYDSQINIGTFHAKYTYSKVAITLGHFYDQFGSGLVLNTWEDRQLGINNAIRGLKIAFNPTDKFEVIALYGNNRVGFDVSRGTVFGLDTNYDLSSDKNALQIGLSYVGRNQKTNNTSSDLNPTTHALSGRVNYAKNMFYGSLEGIVKSKDALVEEAVVYEDNLFYGNALLLELGITKKGFGFSTSMRRLENMNFYANREAAGNTYNDLTINFIPALTKQQGYSLANLYVYQAQSNLSITNQQKSGEIGLQWDLFYKFKKKTTLGGKYGTKLSVNFSNWYGLNAKYNSIYKRAEVKFLDLGERYFTDFNIEINKKFSKKTYVLFTYINSYYNKGIVEGGNALVKSNIGIIDITHRLTKKQSMRLEAQHLWTKDDKQNWAAATAEFNFNSRLSIFATDMYNYGNSHPENRDHYYNFGGSYTKNTSRFSLSYGRQRGGLLCVGGVCRVVPPATGVSFSVSTSF